MSPRGVRRSVRVTPAIAWVSLASFLAVQLGMLPQNVRLFAVALLVPATIWTAMVGALWLGRRERGMWMLGVLLGVFVIGFLGLMTYATIQDVLRGRTQDLMPLAAAWFFGVTMLRFIAGVSLSSRHIHD